MAQVPAQVPLPDITGNRLTSIALFCRAAEALSFTAAADAAGTTPSAVSKAVRRLEDHLRVKLFERTTRSIRLTADGASYHATCREAIARIHEAERRLAYWRSRPQGVLRISMPPSYGVVDLIARLPRYVAQHGHEVRVVATLTNAVAELVTDGCDVAVRIGTVADPRVVARHLCNAEVKVVASPRYLECAAPLRKPEDLGGHPCIDLLLPDTHKAIPWEFGRARQRLQVPVVPSIAVDHPLAAASAAVAGGGLARLLDFTVAADIAAGRLVEVLAPFRPPPVPVSVVYRGGRHIPATVRSFVDFLVNEHAGANRLRPASAPGSGQKS